MRMNGYVSYGHWEFCDGIPVTRYLEPVVHSKRVHFFHEKDEDLFKVHASVKPVSCYRYNDQRKNGRDQEKQIKRRKQNGACYAGIRQPKAVDEDLYKIPPELLYQLPKRKRMLGNFLSGCLRLDCIA
ncbi:uncharacterized protein A4U43_C10F12850 [Asparagus officinalis]|uniref:Uncharacterized protein n=1 Tax=Asparagus officinalis TaxID=4686 RepID=A0A5P1E2L7_ASPOF|nr:uncharacterized protein LOC109826329 [Asparagus officinalis]XP_020248940.1 uncharacterized protein LOC109826329 [Asparagus officinalis]ONK56780.1 uncharacterized protein A4U43_C10F12850 [Asparagus officinalis]